MKVTSDKKKELYLAAKEALGRAYAPYSGFSVGAALLSVSGNIYTGTNVESGAFAAGICAERAALATAVTAGDREFAAIAVASSEGEAWPCGICRQALYEFSPEMEVITGSRDEDLFSEKLSDLLPHGFRLERK